MNEVLKIFLSMSVSGGLLIPALLLGKPWLRDKISRQWQYYIWLVVVTRLLLPFGPQVNLLGKTYKAVDQAITQTAPMTPRQSGISIPGEEMVPSGGLEEGGERADPPAQVLTSAHPLQDIGALFTDHVWLIWLVAAMGLLIRKVTIYQGFMRYIRAGMTPVCDIERLDLLSVAAKRAGVKAPIELCVNPLISSPLLIGFFHPCIVLPGADIPEKDFQYIVLHELTHYKRKDMFYKWLVQVTVCMHWFNPLVRLMSREITRACEFSCDEAVLEKMGSGSAQDYGKTLLDAMAAVGKYRENLGAVTLSENKRLLKERLGAIMKFRKPSKAVKALTAALTLCVILGASFVGVYTMGSAAESARGTSSGAPLDTTGRPSLSLNVSSAAVNVSPSENHKIWAEYNPDVYGVDIDQQDSHWKVSISCKTRRNTNDETIKLYLPDVDYGSVDLSADSGHLICGLIRSGNITGNFNMASVLLTLPEGFRGSVDVTADSGYFQLVSRDDFKNTTATITDNGDWGEIYKPGNFKEKGDVSTFTDGTGANVIKITREGSGVMGIYGSDWFDISDFIDQLGNPPQSFQPEQTPPPADPGVSISEAERYYEDGSLPLFQIAFARLDEKAREKWLDRIYEDDRITFWDTAVSLLGGDQELIDRWAEKIYADGDIAFFSILAKHMSEDGLEKWLDQALEDGNWAFQSVLSARLGRSDEFAELQDRQEKQWEEERAAEYQAVGVTVNGKDYYYQGQLVNIFLDIVRTDKSFYTLNMNPKGTVNIKIVRNEKNEITGAAYMTEAEVKELLGDMDDPDDADAEIIPVDLKTVEAGETIFLGEYTLTQGDKIWYDILVETGNGIQVYFAEDQETDVVHWSVHNLRQGGEPLKCMADFTVEPPAKPGTYKLFLQAADGALGNVKGSISISSGDGD